MEKKILFELPNKTTTWNVDIFLKALKESKDQSWQAEMFYKYGYYFRNAKNCISLLNNLYLKRYFDIKTFLLRQLEIHGDYYIDISLLYIKLSQLIVIEIGKEKITLIPNVRDKSWRTESLVLPSITRNNVYYWSSYREYKMSISIYKPKLLLSTLLEGMKKDKLS